MGTTAQKLQKILDSKDALKASINNKGGNITDTTPFSEYATQVDNLPSGGGTSVSDSVSYYKAHRPSNWPYFPLPSEMTEEDDVIYMLYDASGYMCCPAFNVTFTSCICTIMKYMDTELVGSYTESVTSGTAKYLQFYEEDVDYSTYNYVLIKLQGSITKWSFVIPQFNGVQYNTTSSSEVIDVSGKCNNCKIQVGSISAFGFSKRLEYFSFLGANNTSMSYMFSGCNSLQTIPELDTSNVTSMQHTLSNCTSLQTIPELDTSKVTNMSYMFYNCPSLQSIPMLNTSKVTNMSSMFSGCNSLQTIPELDTSNVTSMMIMFYNCPSLQSIPMLNTSKVTNMSSMFSGCNSLQTIPELDTSNVTSIQGMFNDCFILQKALILNPSVSFSLSYSTMMTRENILVVLNNLATVTTAQTLALGSTNLAKLTDEDKAIATNKGWTLT